MRSYDLNCEVVAPASLDAKTDFEWRQLSAQVLDHRRAGICSNTNIMLESAIEREPQSPLAGAYQLWIGDNLVRDGGLRKALSHYDKAVDSFAANEPLVQTIDGVGGALLKKAQTAALAKDWATAVETYQTLSRHLPDDPDPLFQAGLLLEETGDRDGAAAFYRSVARKDPSNHTDDPAELARRCLERLSTPDSAFFLTVEHVVDAIEAALSSKSGGQLRALASTTHFAISPAGSHGSFESLALLDELCRDFAKSEIRTHRSILGGGDKRYLRTSGWRGKWFRGEVILQITRSARGWQWTGCGLTAPNQLWIDHWQSAVSPNGQPIALLGEQLPPFELLAPWPKGLCFAAGGFSKYIFEQSLILELLVLPWPLGAIAAAALTLIFSARECGFGVRGFYYNDVTSHIDEDAFAIDFTRYHRFAPYINRSEGTPVLAARGGIVSRVSDGTPSGSSTASNTVHVQHGDPSDPTNTDRYTSRYLHMQGPGRIVVSQFMPIFTGNRIGLMDDTGRSFLSHLHYSIHDRQIAFPNISYGRSIPPTPMNGVELKGLDSGKCVCSTNVETFGEPPMISPTGYAVQNWTITPVATAVGQISPTRIEDQTFQLVLTGVASLDMKGVSSAQWRRETLLMGFELRAPIQFAASRYGVNLPQLPEGDFAYNFQVEQGAPHSGLASIFNQDRSINSGFAVDAWRFNPLFTGTDLFTNASVPNLFAGIQADIAVRDSDAYLLRVNYHVTLVGRIVFSPIIIR